MPGSVSASGTVPGGVAVTGIIRDTSDPLKRYEPGNPDADGDGYVAYPDINPLTEMVDLMGATRSYGMNATAIQAEKGMIATSLELLK
jgi:flagellar basal-body rod protein FlgC